MRKKGLWKKGLALSLAIAMGLSAAGCGSKKPAGGSEAVDDNRTQLYVFNFAGGFGAEWLADAKERYEELHKDDVYEDGKKGVQIVINNSKVSADVMQNQIEYNKEEVYFTERAYYYTLLEAGVLGDITDAVNQDLSVYGDEKGSTIANKMTAEQNAFYGVEEGGEKHYYAIPHYSGFAGLVYNVDLFDEEKYYFADGVTDAATLEDYFIARSDDKRSAGPDGQYDTSDDGLPATFDEFYLLCDYIAERGQTAVSWRGAEYDDYLRQLALSVAANVDGKDQTVLGYSMNGTATTLGTASANGFAADASSTAVTAANGYEMYRQAGRYYALEFLNKLATSDKWLSELAFNSSYSHVNAQEDFLYAGHDNGETAPIAMLVEGCWWENEAQTAFDAMTDSMGDDFAKENRKFAMMPLPKASAADAGKNTLFDGLYSLCFMKSNIEDWKKPLALDFIAFVNSQESLVKFTQSTNTPKALEYTMSEDEMKGMTHFGRSVMELKQNSDVVYPYSSEAIYVNQSGQFHSTTSWDSVVGGTAYNGPVSAFHEDGVSAADYFKGMYENYKGKWNQKVY